MTKNLFILFLSVLLLMVLTSCGNNKNVKDQPSESTISQTDADKARPEAEVDALQSKSDSMKAEHATPVETSQPLQVATKQRLLEEMLIGEWFDQSSFVNMEGIGSLVFNADGTGSEIIINYAWFDSEIGYIAPGTTGEETYKLKWSLDGNTVNLEFDQKGWRNRSYTFVDNEQQLQWHDKDGSIGNVFVRTKPTIPDGEVELASLLGQHQVTQAALKRRFLGEWCWDVMIWRFNDDGTGVIDIPAFGQYPADKKEFEFTVSENNGVGDAILNISLVDGKQIIYFATFGNESGGSVMLNPQGGNAIKLTRSYDIENSPITDEILEEGLDLIESFSDPAGYIEGILVDKLVESFKVE